MPLTTLMRNPSRQLGLTSVDAREVSAVCARTAFSVVMTPRNGVRVFTLALNCASETNLSVFTNFACDTLRPSSRFEPKDLGTALLSRSADVSLLRALVVTGFQCWFCFWLLTLAGSGLCHSVNIPWRSTYITS